MKVWTIKKVPHNALTNCHWFEITNIRTGKTYKHYAQEFCYGQMHYDPATDKFPLYIHAQMWDMA
jgi:hypothetical protein